MKSTQITILFMFFFSALANVQASGQQTPVLALVNQWNEANSTKNIKKLSELYAPNVFYYGTLLTKENCIKDKINFFKKRGNLQQQIIDPPFAWQLSPTKWKVTFTKRIKFDGEIKDYPSSLIFEKKKGKYEIVLEMDAVTEKNLTKRYLSAPDFKKSHLNFEYEPVVSTLVGTITIKKFYGPPNYGETPETDQLNSYFIFIPNRPVNILSLEEDDGEINLEPTEWNVQQIQLSYEKNKDFSQYKNKKVILSGTFFHAATGGHHTDILMNVTNVQLVP